MRGILESHSCGTKLTIYVPITHYFENAQLNPASTTVTFSYHRGGQGKHLPSMCVQISPGRPSERSVNRCRSYSCALSRYVINVNFRFRLQLLQSLFPRTSLCNKRNIAYEFILVVSRNDLGAPFPARWMRDCLEIGRKSQHDRTWKLTATLSTVY